MALFPVYFYVIIKEMYGDASDYTYFSLTVCVILFKELLFPHSHNMLYLYHIFKNILNVSTFQIFLFQFAFLHLYFWGKTCLRYTHIPLWH